MSQLAAKFNRPGLAWIVSCQAGSIGYAVFFASYIIAGTTGRIVFYATIVAPFVLFFGHKVLRSVFRSQLFLISILLIGYLWLSVLWSPTGSLIELSIESVRVFMLGIFIAMTAFFAVRCSEFLRTVPVVLAVLGGVAAIASIVIFYMIENNQFPLTRMRAFGSGQNPLRTTPSYSFIVAWVVVWLAETRSFALYAKSLVAFCLVPIVGLLLLTQGRAALLGVVLSLVPLLLPRNTEHLRRTVIVAAILALVVIVLLVGPFQHLFERGLSYRPDVWRAGLEIFLQRPWFGHGLHASLEVIISDTILKHPHNILPHPHNILITVLMQGGIVALGLFLWMLAAYARVAWQQFQREGSVLLPALMICGFINAVFDIDAVMSTINRVWFVIWIPIGLAIAYEVRLAEAAAELGVGEAAGTVQPKI